MIRAVDSQASVTVATSIRQAAQVRAQLGDRAAVSIEPCRRDTFPAIALACAYLASRGVGEDEPVVVCPVDPWVEESYFVCLKTLSEAASTGRYRLTLMGIEPKEPSERYGYILPDGDRVRAFREKPDVETAKKIHCRGRAVEWRRFRVSTRLSAGSGAKGVRHVKLR